MTPGTTTGAARFESPGRTSGWTVVAALFVVLAVNAGFSFYGLSAYVSALTEHGRFSLTQATIGPTISFGVSGLAGPIVARLLRVIDIRILLCTGAVVTGSMLAAMGHVQTPWQLWSVFACFGLGSSLFSMLPASALVMRWYGAAPGRPVAIVSTGFGAGGTLVPPFLTVAIGHYGLAAAGPALAAIVIGTVFVTTLLFVRRPAGPTAPDEAHQQSNASAQSEGVLPALRQRAFLLIGIGYGLLFLNQVGIVTHLLTVGREQHLNGAAALSALALSNLVFRIACIPFLARAGVRRFALTFVVLQVAGLLLLALASTTIALIAGAILFGSTIGNLTVSQPLTVHRAFGVARYASVFARSFLFITAGTTAAPALFGALHAALGGYTWPLLLAGCSSAVGGLLLFLVPSAATPPAPAAAPPA
jgi:MFS family permease